MVPLRSAFMTLLLLSAISGVAYAAGDAGVTQVASDAGQRQPFWAMVSAPTQCSLGSRSMTSNTSLSVPTGRRLSLRCQRIARSNNQPGAPRSRETARGRAAEGGPKRHAPRPGGYVPPGGAAWTRMSVLPLPCIGHRLAFPRAASTRPGCAAERRALPRTVAGASASRASREHPRARWGLGNRHDNPATSGSPTGPCGAPRAGCEYQLHAIGGPDASMQGG